jgi:hypothetical protein
MNGSVNNATAVIVNLTEQHWTLHRSYGVFAIHGCAPGEPFTLTRVAGPRSTNANGTAIVRMTLGRWIC